MAPAPGSSKSIDQATGATYARNDDWWGGTTPLDSARVPVFDDGRPDGHRLPGRLSRRDRPVRRPVGRAALTSDPNVIATRAALHRQIWMRCDKGQFATSASARRWPTRFDREAMIQQLFQGKAELGNDHVIARSTSTSIVASRSGRATSTGQVTPPTPVATINATLHVRQLLEIPDLAVLIQSHAARAGSRSTSPWRASTRSTARSGAPPSQGPAVLGAAELGSSTTVTAPHPTCILNAALKTKGVWNSSQYNSPEFDARSRSSRSRRRRRPEGGLQEDRDDPQRDVPIALPYFYNYLAGSSKTFNGRLLERPRSDVLQAPPHRSHKPISKGRGAHVAPLLVHIHHG
jgi:peptide/nickel transport system substrate-binding protein